MKTLCIYSSGRVFVLSVLISCLCSGNTTSQPNYISFSENRIVIAGDQAIRPSLEIIRSTVDEFTFEWSFPGAKATRTKIGGEVFDVLDIPGFGRIINAGEPALPVFNFMVAVPDGAVPLLSVSDESSIEYPDFMILPSSGPEPDSYGMNRKEAEADSIIYSADSFYPASPLEIIKTLYLRGAALAVVQVRPVRFNPVRKTIRVCSRITATVTFEGQGKSFDRLAGENSAHFNDYMRNVVINGNCIPEGSVRSSLSPCSDYIIITPTQYKQAADTLAKWKRQLGYSVEVVDRSSWTSTQVKNAIHNRYASWKPKPDYFVILGDQSNSGLNAVFVPGEIYFKSSNGFPSDLYFSCMDGTNDYVPDMAHGRISVSTASEALSVVQKIIGYERDPVTDSSFYLHGLHCAYFQDQDGNDTADRRFAQTSEEVLHYMVDTLDDNYMATRLYYADNDVTPKFWNNGFYSNGEPVPGYLRKPDFDWKVDLYEINEEIDSGRFYVLHRDHGNYGKWEHPLLTCSNVTSLKNGNLLPVVFSINCKTGNFGISSGDCLAEAFLKKSSGGAVGVVAASYISYSGYNDALAMGLFDAIWPGLTPGFTGTGHTGSPPYTSHSAMYTMGDVLNQALFRMTESWGDPWSNEVHQHRIFHWHGDPAMRIFTKYPDSITVSGLPDTLDCCTQSVVMSNCSCKDAFASVSYDGGLLGRTQLSNGNGTIDFAQGFPESGITAYITIYKQDMRPLVKKVYVRDGKPAAFFSADRLMNFPNRTFSFYDHSACEPTAWQWTFTGPGTVSYVNNTTSASQNPQVSFSALGKYDVKLKVTNSFGSDSLTRNSYITISSVLPIFDDIFESFMDWTTLGEFELGPPLGFGGNTGNPDPPAPYTGSNVLGCDLSGLGAFPGDYEPGIGFNEYQAISPVINCVGYENIQLTFWRWLNVGPAGTDRATVDVSPDNGSSWVTVYENPPVPVEDNFWNFQEIDISGIADNLPGVRIRFTVGPTDPMDCYSGWNIDSLVVQGEGMPLITAFPYLVDFENGGMMPEGWSQEIVTGSVNWTFQAGGNAGNPPAAYSGAYNALLFNPLVSEARTRLVTPALDLSFLTSPRLTFWHAQAPDQDQDELTLFYRNIRGGEWKKMPSAIWNYAINDWVCEIFVLPEPSDYYLIAFEGKAGGGHGIVLDDVLIDNGYSSTEWTGLNGNQWLEHGNWDPVAPNASTDVVIPAQCPDTPVVGSSTSCQSLVMHPGSRLTVTDQDTLSVKESLTLQADETGTASLVVYGAIDHNRYNTNVEKRITQNRWHYISSPVDTAYSMEFLSLYLKAFNEPDSSWNYIVPTDAYMEPGIGYASWASELLTGDKMVYFSGNLITGDVAVPVSATDQNNDLVIGDGEGWNLAGNPYPSAIDWDHPDWLKQNIGGSVYVYDGTQYLSWNGSAGSLTDGIIPAMQAFFVKAFDDPPALLIPNAARIHGVEPYKAGQGAEHVLSLTVEGNGYRDAAFIQFRPDATESFDHQSDAYKIKGIKEAPQLYTTDGNTSYSIHSLPTQADTALVTLAFEPGTNGVFILKYQSALIYELYEQVLLTDLLEESVIVLGHEGMYEFDANCQDMKQRFRLMFVKSCEIPEQKGYTLYFDGNSVILKTFDSHGTVDIYDVTGKKLCGFESMAETSYRIECIKTSGIYLVRFQTNGVATTSRVVFP